MMERHDEKDREIERLFEAAREKDREAAPAFRQIVAQGRLDRHRHERPRVRRRHYAWMAAASTVTVVVLAAWLGTSGPRAPEGRDMAVSKYVPPSVSPAPQASPTARSQDVARSKIADRVDEPHVADRPEPQGIESVHGLGHVAAESPGGRSAGADVESPRARAVDTAANEIVAPVPRPAPASVPAPAEAALAYERALVEAPGVPQQQMAPPTTPHGARDRDFKAVVSGAGAIVDMEQPVPGGARAEFERAQAGLARMRKYKDDQALVEEYPPAFNTESYGLVEENRFLDAAENPLSTFSIDVDTASYANVRRFLTHGQRPPRDAVRIEEMVNYFRYDYPGPAGRDPFGASIEIAACPWNADHRLARIGLKGREIDHGRREPSNLVFLIDVSGSMNHPSKLPLVQQSLGLLADELDDRDRVAIVVYAGASGLVLPSTPGSSRGEIRSAIGRLSAGGSTNGGAGLELAYATARENFVRGGTNRVILATDGDFNVGVTSQAELLSLIESDAQRGIFLTALGFGMGNYKDSTLEMLADKGNGNYAYIDDLREARKVLVEELSGTLVTIAKDVKIQVEFNPAEVGAYRLIGYENRMLRKEDFHDDRKDAGEIGAGHTVTALYEIVPLSARRDVDVPPVDPLRYQKGPALTEAARRGELFTLKLRYKEPEGQSSRLLEFPAHDTGARRGSADFEFAAAVAGFGMLLRDSEHAGDFTYGDVRDLARGAVGRGAGREYRDELVRLIDRAAALD